MPEETGQAAGPTGSAQRRDEQALACAESSLRLKEARLGPAHETVGIACNNLAGQLWRLGRMDEAEAMAARGVEIDEEAGVSDASRAVGLSTHGIMTEGLSAGGWGRRLSCAGSACCGGTRSR